jgi:gluconolactonase
MKIVASGFRTVEGPTLEANGDLVFSDVRGGGVYRLAAGGAVEVVIPKRKGVGGLCLHIDGGIVASGRSVCHVHDGVTRELFGREDVEPAPGLTVGGFNDIGADPAGRIFAGVQRFTPDGDYGPGLLVMITGERVGEVVFDGLLPNGNSVSPDGRWLYQMDSRGKRVLVFDLRANPPVMVREFTTEPVPGAPDGSAVDANGDIWIAFHHGGCVGHYDADGRLVDRIECPTPTVTSLCFGPAGSGSLFVVTDDETDSADPPGCIYQLDVGVDGAPVHAARL